MFVLNAIFVSVNWRWEEDFLRGIKIFDGGALQIKKMVIEIGTENKRDSGEDDRWRLLWRLTFSRIASIVKRLLLLTAFAWHFE